MEKAIENLEQQVVALTKLCADLHAENHSVKNSFRLAEKEAEQLREKNRIARGRVEQIVDRLKTIEA